MILSGISKIFKATPKVLSEKIIPKTGTKIINLRQGADTFTRVNYGNNAVAQRMGLTSLLKGIDKQGKKFIEATFTNSEGKTFITRNIDTIKFMFKALKEQPNLTPNDIIAHGTVLDKILSGLFVGGVK